MTYPIFNYNNFISIYLSLDPLEVNLEVNKQCIHIFSQVIEFDLKSLQTGLSYNFQLSSLCSILTFLP